jgi:hypothetical protein
MAHGALRSRLRNKVNVSLERMDLAWKEYQKRRPEWKRTRAIECLKAGAKFLEKSHKSKNM